MEGLDSPLNMLHEIHSQALIFLYHYWYKLQALNISNSGGAKDINFVKR